MTHRLLVMMSPDHFDRNTEFAFSALFEKSKIIYVFPSDELARYEPFSKKDILLFEGGTDISSELYGETPVHETQKPDIKRDQHEIMFWNAARKAGAASVGVCRGAQLLCVLSGGSLIQHVTGHSGYIGTQPKGHQIRVPKHAWGQEQILFTTSAHHQMMHPYKMDKNDWVSYGECLINHSDKYKTASGTYKPGRLNRHWKEQEIIWFPKTRALCIQGHPEWFESMRAPFVQYCQWLVWKLMIREGK